MDSTIITELLKALFGAIAAYLFTDRRQRTRGLEGRGTPATVTVSIDHGLAGVDVVVRVSSDLNKSSRDLFS